MMKDQKVTRELGLGEKSYCMGVKGDAGQAQTCTSQSYVETSLEYAEKINM